MLKRKLIGKDDWRILGYLCILVVLLVIDRVGGWFKKKGGDSP